MQCGFFLTAIWTFLIFQNGVQLSKVLATRPPGYLDFDNLPETNFTCEGKVIGGYYADIETGCQMFHVCTIGQKGDMTDIKFLCLNGTVFDQETRVCERVDEVDCSKSKDFYDLNLELYNNGFILSEEESTGDDSKSEENPESEELYDESYDTDTEEPPSTTTKGTRTSTSTTTTTTSTTTSKPIIYSSIKPPYSVIIPGGTSKNKNAGTHIIGLSQQGYDNRNGAIPTVGSNKAVVPLVRPAQPNYQGLITSKHQQQPLENKNVGTHLTGVIPTAGNVQTPRPYGYVTTQSYEQGQFNQKQHPLDTGLKPPPTSYRPYLATSSYKPPSYETFKNHYFPSSTQSPITSILINNYNPKHQGIEEIHSSEQGKRPVVVVSHHFPTITPVKSNYDEFSGFPRLTGPGAAFVKHKQPAQQQQPRPSLKIQHHHHPQQLKPNPTILALQSQQKKVHQLHQEGLEIAEHQIAQVASRNAEISNLRSQKIEDRKDYFETQPSHRETKEIHSNNRSPFSKPAIAIVTSTSSTSSRVQNKPVVTTFVKTVTSSGSGKHVAYKEEPEYKKQLEKLFATAEQQKKESNGESGEAEDSEEGSDMDLEQLLLAWKLKTNQEVTKEDIERVFSSLDTSKFKNGQTISLSDIFQIMNNGSSEETTRVPPISYDDYTEEDVPYDPFYKDVPKVSNNPKRLKRSGAEGVNITVYDNGRFVGRELRKHRGEDHRKDERVFIADFKLLTVASEAKTERTSAINKASREGRKSEEEEEYGESVVVITPVPTTERAFPETAFTCQGKTPGGYYADLQVDCQLFHICSSVDDNERLIDHKFFCGEGTKFNQKSRTCEAEALVDCTKSPRYYYLNENFRIPATEMTPPEVTFESLKVTS